MNSSIISFTMMLACLGELESGNDDRKVGRAAEVSRYQIKPSVWHSDTKMPLSDARKEHLAALVVFRVQGNRVREFERRTGRAPTVREWYVLWNAPAQAYQLRWSAAVTQRANRFSNLVEDSLRKGATAWRSSKSK